MKNNKAQNIIKEIDFKKRSLKYDSSRDYFNSLQKMLFYEAKMPHLNEIIKKRIFKVRLPLPKEIKCQPHLRNKELAVFLSLLTKDTNFLKLVVAVVV